MPAARASSDGGGSLGYEGRGPARAGPASNEGRFDMAQGYWIAHVTITDPELYKQYVAANAAAFKKYRARFVVRGGRSVSLDSPDRSQQRHVVIEFDSFDVAKACYESPEYQAALAIRKRCSNADFMIVEGWDG
jgi:uncharacterized protein (DUF1330 family)